jgi:quercetin dioxygenase-like cupin family protein
VWHGVAVKFVHRLADYRPPDAAPVHSTPFFVGQDIIACLVRLQPGAFVPEHQHAHQDEIFDVIEGEGTFILDGDEIRFSSGMTICVPANTSHGLRAADRPWILRETVHRRLYARQAIWRALQKRLHRLRDKITR